MVNLIPRWIVVATAWRLVFSSTSSYGVSLCIYVATPPWNRPSEFDPFFATTLNLSILWRYLESIRVSCSATMLAFLELINSKISFLLFLMPLIFHCTMVEAAISGAIFRLFVKFIIFICSAVWVYELFIVCMFFFISFLSFGWWWFWDCCVVSFSSRFFPSCCWLLSSLCLSPPFRRSFSRSGARLSDRFLDSFLLWVCERDLSSSLRAFISLLSFSLELCARFVCLLVSLGSASLCPVGGTTLIDP